MPDPTEPTATTGLPYELARPLPPRTWRDRLDDALAGGGGGLGAGRLIAAAGALAVAAVVGWRLLAPPAPPPEMDIPFAEQDVAATGDRSTDAGSAADVAASTPAATGEGGSGAPPGSNGGASGAPGTAAGDEVVVHVVGAVVAPGVQRLPTGSRVVDAVDAAGGALGDADLGRINLAGLLTDGQQVYVLRQGETPPPTPAGAGPAADGGAGAAGGLIDINQATTDQLDELPGVGPATAAAIIAHREQHGPFASVDDLIDVRGIGEAKLEQLRDLATV
jgi:competence protein ComEA